MRLEQVQFIGFVLRNSCVNCYIVFLKRLQNVLNSHLNGKYASPIDSKDIKVCLGDMSLISLEQVTYKCYKYLAVNVYRTGHI